jgi:hypothetical protein
MPPPARGLARLLGRRTRAGVAKPAALERPIWQTVIVLYAAILLLAVTLMTAAFLAAWIATGHAY